MHLHAEEPAVQRLNRECAELLTSYRGLSWRLKRVEEELGCDDSHTTYEALRAEKVRLMESLRDIQARLRTDWDRLHVSKRQGN